MVGVRKRHDAPLKARVALEAVRGEKTIAQLSSEYKVHSNQIRQWKRKLRNLLLNSTGKSGS
jgi:putative transposase